MRVVINQAKVDMAGRWLPARFRRPRDQRAVATTPEQKAEETSWELLDKVANEQMLADTTPRSELVRERDHCLYQISLIATMLSKANAYIQVEAPVLRERAQGYAKRMEEIDNILNEKGSDKWLKR